jgi:hypothetical protein
VAEPFSGTGPCGGTEVTPETNQSVRRSVNNNLSKSTLEIKEKLDETQIILGEMKSLQAKQQCTIKQSQAERQKSASENIKTLTDLSDITVGKAMADLGQNNASTSNNMIYWYIGGGVVVVAIITLIVLKNRK